jgi:hypothetical protein
MAIAASLLGLIYPLATGREWARRVLVCAVVFIGVIFPIGHILRLFDPNTFDLSSERLKLISLSIVLDDLSSLILVFSLVVFGVVFLCHPDIIATFRRESSTPQKA